MKILLYGDYYKSCSGFAKEFRDIIPTFIKKGHEVRQVALHYDGLSTNNKIFCYPTLLQGAGGHFAPEVLRRAIIDYEPDIILSIGDYFSLPYLVPVISKPYKKQFKFIHWGVADGSPIDRHATNASTWVHHHIFHSKFGHKVLQDSLSSYLKYYNNLDEDVIYPAVDTNTYKKLENIDQIKEKYNLKDKFTILFLSRNQYRKNIPVLFEAIKIIKKIIPNIVLLVHSVPTVSVNGTPEGYDLDGIVKYLNIENNIAVLTSDKNNILPDNYINLAYNLSDVVCVPTMGEGFGLFITEAMAAGKPNISTDCSSITELLSHDRGYLVKPSAYIYNGGTTRHAVINSEDLANAIFTLYNDKSLREKYVANGKEFIKDMTPENTANKLLDIFDKVIKENKSPIAMDLL